ncbi:hypothetical protein XU18_0691 [Perkinsela sp. CCAP 1560/4]|nr:hypothetical protein XU18_4497 [Perkinsela sp. CCAP 1560/4]KNH08921.1 hypothetical protein XU18_0691 [Perkinsela sp. CCAP 1560/4]|eukprot:KNH04287.1 hypothetical protein XU18_4497 [Perkinsela sp. CCAP 1560/4]
MGERHFEKNDSAFDENLYNESQKYLEEPRLKKSQHKQHDKKDRATVENVMDPRTRLIIYALVRNGFLEAMHGCVSTGKEANVYHAIRGDNSSAAIKIYRTSVLVFKDRERYVKGDYRFQRYSKSNPRKMVQKWAEKEARNLRRLESAGIPAPRVFILKQNVLVMSFLGENGWPYSRLSDCTDLKYSHGASLYHKLISLLRRLYKECNLIHGDYSEYNLLVQMPSAESDAGSTPEIYVIDVSQSIEPDHPNAMEFLRRDIANVDRFFADALPPSGRYTIERIFMFVIGRIPSLDTSFTESGDVIPDDVFRQIPIPRSLGIYSGSHISSDVEKQYSFLTADLSEEESDNSFSTHELADALDDAEGAKDASAKQFTLADATKPERKDHRKEVKLENRERRVQKSQARRQAKGKK